MNKYNGTFVSGFISIKKSDSEIKRRSDEKYMNLGKIIVNTKVPKVIFLDKNTKEKYFKDYIDELTIFIDFELEDMYLYKYRNQLPNFDQLITDNKEKDSIDHLMIFNQKMDWMKKAIDCNHYKTNQFIWIDFGINHVIDNKSLLQSHLLKMNNKIYDNIRIPFILDFDKVIFETIDYSVDWEFAGGIFGGNKDKLLKFCDMSMNQCVKIIKKYGILLWEVNIWTSLLHNKEFKSLLDTYKSNHNYTMLTKY